MSTDPRYRRDPLPERKSRLEARWSVWLERWELDPGFRRMASAIIAMLTLVGVVVCFCGGVTLAQSITGVRLWSPTESPLNGVFDVSPAPTYPVIQVSPVAGKPTDEPVFAATSEVGPPTPTATPTPTVTPGPSPTPTVSDTLTPVPCPTLGSPSSPQGGTAKSSTSPSPMIAGCLATLYLSAPTQKNAKVTIALIFGLPQPTCQVALITQTDSSGKASVTFTVPPTACFHGSGRTSGTITIGEDSSAASDLPING